MTDQGAIQIRRAAQQIAARLSGAGFLAYFAGGCVRDRLLGIAPEDIDIATAATPDDVRRLFPQARGVGAAFGVMLVRQGEHEFEVATFRADCTYHDGRRPSEVRFASALEDAKRRDFTINGLFEVPATSEIVDFVEGQKDLDARVLRAIGEPDERFAEDHLRLLRAARFAARFGFVIDPPTALAIREHASKLALIARERIGAEVRRMLEHASRVRAVSLLEEFGLDGIALGGATRRSTGRRLSWAPEHATFASALAAWLLDREGPGPDAAVSEAVLKPLRDALALSNRDDEALRDILDVRSSLREFASLPTHARKRLAARSGFAAALWLTHSDDSLRAASIAEWRTPLDDATVAPTPWITGADLINSGLVPGPSFRDLLDAAYDAQLDGLVSSRDEALSFMERLIRTGRKG